MNSALPPSLHSGAASRTPAFAPLRRDQSKHTAPKLPSAGGPRSALAIVALGSNLGDSIAVLRQAMERLREFSTESLLRSSLWQTTPVDCPPDSALFVNAVAGLFPLQGETPESLLAKLQRLEKEFGRQPKTVLNEARPLDLDLIAFGQETRATPLLILPHPRAHLRRFVLQPLAEIAPELILPGQLKTVEQLLNDLPPDAGIKKLANAL